MRKKHKIEIGKHARRELTSVIDDEIARLMEREMITAARQTLRDELATPERKQKIKAVVEELIRSCEEVVTSPRIWEQNRSALAEHLVKLMGERMTNHMHHLVNQAIPESPPRRR